jgi:cysteine desulfurase
MGLSRERARASLRFSLGHGVDAAQVDRALELLPPLVERARTRRAA